MEIKFFGGKSLLLSGKKESVLVDCGKEMFGKCAARTVVFTDTGDDFLGLQTDKVVIKGPGEYEVGGVEIAGRKGIFVIDIDGVAVGILKETAEKFDEKKIDGIGAMDVLVVNVASKKINSKDMVDLAKKLGVNYLIPVGFEEKDDSLIKFLDEVDEEELEASESIKIDKDNLPEGMEIVLLKKSV